MIEIRTKYQDFQGTSALVIFMSKDGETVNVALDTKSMFVDAWQVEKTLEAAIKSLVKSLYPEMRDPLCKMKRELREVSEKRESLINAIQCIQAARDSA